MWSVAITTQEFEAAEELRRLGHDVFLPYTRERVRQPGRGRAVYKMQNVARWPRYLFVSGSPGEAKSVRGFVSFGGERAVVRDEVIALLRKGCAPDGRVIRLSDLYNVGDVLRFVGSSPLAGLSGEVSRLDDSTLSLLVAGRAVTTSYASVRPA